LCELEQLQSKNETLVKELDKVTILLKL
jgi:hypothetical protein